MKKFSSRFKAVQHSRCGCDACAGGLEVFDVAVSVIAETEANARELIKKWASYHGYEFNTDLTTLWDDGETEAMKEGFVSSIERVVWAGYGWEGMPYAPELVKIVPEFYRKSYMAPS